MQVTAHTTPLVHRRAPGATFLGPVRRVPGARGAACRVLLEAFDSVCCPLHPIDMIHSLLMSYTYGPRLLTEPRWNSDQWSKCRLQNGPGAGEHVLCPLLATTNRIPYLFPATLADLRALDRSSVLALLHVYEQNVDPDIELDAARRAFARFVGAPPYRDRGGTRERRLDYRGLYTWHTEPLFCNKLSSRPSFRESKGRYGLNVHNRLSCVPATATRQWSMSCFWNTFRLE
ncbi:hypothetical protein B0H16DRAFT_186407 [Mycena metata]|uniref:Uncharacterized protein n=1 Tax=Mycena metata TaxID=1033252 RepID=A0AAD7JTK4_9AGAR|nr:hypothetical protein B0H16DRAFT_186407 [Mycena metata]